MNDKIILNGLEFHGHCGCTEEERKIGQPLRIDVEIGVDLLQSGKSDDLNDTIDYVKVIEIVRGLVENDYNLIEALAQEIADNILSARVIIESVKVTVHKPVALSIAKCNDVAVSIVRERDVF